MMNAPRARMTHELKTWPEFFIETRGGRKKFELRKNDRDFKVGDELLLKEWDPEPSKLPGRSLAIGYTGRELLVRVDYIMAGVDFGPPDLISPLAPDYVIMSISLIS